MIAGRVAVILPAYNAARALERTVDEIPREVVDGIILTDDGSADETAAPFRLARRGVPQRLSADAG